MSCCNKSIPGLIATGARGVAKSLLRLDRAPDDIIASRRALCRTCPHATKHPTLKTQGLPLISFCRLCSCHLRLKTTNADQSCPAGRWHSLRSPSAPAASPPRRLRGRYAGQPRTQC